MWVRVETSRVGPAQLPSAASWRGSSSFAYRIHWRSGRSGGDDADLSGNAREFVWGERVIASKSTMISPRALGSDRKRFRFALGSENARSSRLPTPRPSGRGTRKHKATNR